MTPPTPSVERERGLVRLIRNLLPTSADWRADMAALGYPLDGPGLLLEASASPATSDPSPRPPDRTTGRLGPPA